MIATVEVDVAHAAMRDASWYRYPGTAARYHVIGANRASACAGLPLVDDRAVALDAVPPGLRCQRWACARHWPEVAP